MYLRFLVYFPVQLVRECEKLLEQTGIAYYPRYEATSKLQIAPPIMAVVGYEPRTSRHPSSHLHMPATAL